MKTPTYHRYHRTESRDVLRATSEGEPLVDSTARPDGKSRIGVWPLVGVVLPVFTAGIALSVILSAKGRDGREAQPVSAVIPAPIDEPESGADVYGKYHAPQAESTSAPEEEPEGFVERTGPTTYRIGQVMVDAAARTIRIPATVAEREQLLEYVLVHEQGKTHESLFSTAVPAKDVQVAALLLKATGESPSIEVSWSRNGGETRIPIADLIELKEVDPGTLKNGTWTYNGSTMDAAGFAASREGSFIALIHDPAALINHPESGALLRDDIFHARAELLPADGVQVTIEFDFSDSPSVATR